MSHGPVNPLLPDDLYDIIERACVAGGVKGMSVAVSYKGEVIFAEGFGKRNDKDPFTAETISQIGSVTKAITATLIGELVAEKKLDWDKTPVSTYLPEFQLKDPILTSQYTITDLLAHRTSMPDLDDIAWFRVDGARLDLIKRLQHLDFPTRRLQFDVNYSNFMYLVAGEVVTRVSGMGYEELVKSRILDPLGLNNTGFTPQQMVKKSDNYAIPYAAESYENAKNGIFEKGYLDPVPMADSAAGDIHSTVLDMVRWGRVIMKSGELDGKQVLEKESVEETLKGHNFMNNTRKSSDFGPVSSYGLGWIMNSYKGQVMYHHSGNVSGCCAHLAFFPDSDLVIASLSNTDVNELIEFLPYYFADHLLGLPKTKDWLFEECPKDTEEYYGDKENDIKGALPERKANKPCLHDFSDLVGTYSDPVYGEVSIFTKTIKKGPQEPEEREKGDGEEEEEALFVKLRFWEGRLEHYHFDTFRTVLKDFAVVLGTLVTFLTDSNGEVSSLRIQFQEDIFEFVRKEEPEDNEEGKAEGEKQANEE
ncbi:hypothetical protein BGZ83_000449 [Gryganskiella cystojenkinii]|nr:hypothetical protein BGZ83_000449 [Gryganskiella cystojenkinii]